MDHASLQLNGRAQQVALLLHLAGTPREEIRDSLGEEAVEFLETPEAEQELERFERQVINAALARAADIQVKLKDHAGEALTEVLDVMRDPTAKDNDRLRAAFGVLDRAGYTPVQKSISFASEVPPELLDRLRGALDEIQGIEAEYEELPALTDGTSPGGEGA